MYRSISPYMTALPFLVAVSVPGVIGLTTTDVALQDRTIISGSYQRAYEDAFTENMPLSDAARASYTAVTLALFGQAGPDVVVAGDWIFTTEEMRAPDETVSFRTALEEARTALAADGITLIPILVPDKARIYADLLPRDRAAALDSRYSQALAVLDELGFPAVDLNAALTQGRTLAPMFMATDTHWSPLGADLAAQVVAEVSPTGTGQFETTLSAPAAFDGDLRAFVDTGPFADWIGLAPEIIRAPITVATSSGLGLFDDVTIDAVLIGTSFSARTEFNFAGALQQATGLSIVNLSEEGRGPFAPMQAALADGTLQDLSPTIVFWEIPERYIHPRSFQ